MLRIKALFLFLAVALLGCGPAEPLWAPDDFVSRQTYRHGGTPSLTLFTVINNRSGGGGHSSLLVNAPSQRVIFDPAGTFKHPHLPERNDVVFGMTDKAVDFYIDYHARITWNVVEQRIEVPAAIAELVLAKIQAHGAVPKAQCANSLTGILSTVPGFEDITRTSFPKRLMQDFATRGVVFETTHYDDSPDDNKGFIDAPVLWLN